MKYYLTWFLVLSFFTGCSSPKIFQPEPQTYKEQVIQKVRSADYNQPYAHTERIYQNLNGAIVAMADQLFTTNTFTETKPSLILTSFVDLNKLNKTTTFGRLLSESMFNELHIRNFHVTDFRGQNAVSVNADGEFHITRDVEKLKDHISATEYIVVGTYVKFENKSILINSRILDSETGSIISTARVIYRPIDCSLFDLCNTPKKPDDFGIDVVTDNCSSVNCPKQQCKDGICDNSSLY